MRERTGRKTTHQATGAVLFALASPNGVVTNFEVELDGVVIGVIGSYKGYVDKKRAGSRIVSSRRDAILWSFHPTDATRTTFGWKSRSDVVHALVSIMK